MRHDTRKELESFFKGLRIENFKVEVQNESKIYYTLRFTQKNGSLIYPCLDVDRHYHGQILNTKQTYSIFHDLLVEIWSTIMNSHFLDQVPYAEILHFLDINLNQIPTILLYMEKYIDMAVGTRTFKEITGDAEIR